MQKEAKHINLGEEELITNIPECFCQPLMKVVYKLLIRDKAPVHTFRTKIVEFIWNESNLQFPYWRTRHSARIQVHLDNCTKCHTQDNNYTFDCSDTFNNCLDTLVIFLDNHSQYPTFVTNTFNFRHSAKNTINSGTSSFNFMVCYSAVTSTIDLRHTTNSIRIKHLCQSSEKHLVGQLQRAAPG